MVQLINPSEIQTGDLSVTLPPATAGTMQTSTNQIPSDSSVTIPAGAYSISIHNTGLEEITVNGFKVEPNDAYRLHSEYNEVTNRRDFCPAVVIVVPAGGDAYYVTYRPSA